MTTPNTPVADVRGSGTAKLTVSCVNPLDHAAEIKDLFVAHERPEFPPEQIDQTQDYTLTQCPDCGGKLQNAAAAPRHSACGAWRAAWSPCADHRSRAPRRRPGA